MCLLKYGNMFFNQIEIVSSHLVFDDDEIQTHNQGFYTMCSQLDQVPISLTQMSKAPCTNIGLKRCISVVPSYQRNYY
jgi:hypothetical protein